MGRNCALQNDFSTPSTKIRSAGETGNKSYTSNSAAQKTKEKHSPDH